MVAESATGSAATTEKKAKANPSEKGVMEFEFCEVCRRNHDQGRRHKYLPAHARALATLLAGFHRKLSNLRFFLRNPSPLRPEHAALNCLWCVFCSCDLREDGSTFAFCNAINHLASSEHLRNLNDFLRKHGGGMNRVDSFRVSEVDFLKWEKGCETLNDAAFSYCDRSIGPSPGSSKDIQHTLTSSYMENFEENSINSLIPKISHSVLPLQSLTNENYKEHYPEISGFPIGGSIRCAATSSSMGMEGHVGLNGTGVFGSVSRQLSDRQSTSHVSNVKSLIGWFPSNATDPRIGSSGDSNQVCQANVHTGAPPPWLEIEEKDMNVTNKAPYMNGLSVSSCNIKKSRKLNPKRVGAAWAEKRRAELDLEKRGEIVPKICDANWLPNFGRVWQAGTRKESRKEFEMEKRKFSDTESHTQFSSMIQPYISKRMRIGSSEDGGDNAHVKENSNPL
ncbi:TITAN-like protein [Canna indica]|uniref:TITAN-like protein n=1 Tax=Canna indica TaxID=4628 RepID=A0AAQ3JQR4_9LILI|nr:TITAN-like protein [Canna indica]